MDCPELVRWLYQLFRDSGSVCLSALLFVEHIPSLQVNSFYNMARDKRTFPGPHPVISVYISPLAASGAGNCVCVCLSELDTLFPLTIKRSINMEERENTC